MTNQPDWPQRQQQLREDEWQTSSALFQLSREILARMRARPWDTAPVKDLIKVLELASKFGRQACGLPTDSKGNQNSFQSWQTQQQDAARELEIQEQLDRVFGKPAHATNTPLQRSDSSSPAAADPINTPLQRCDPSAPATQNCFNSLPTGSRSFQAQIAPTRP